MTTRFCSSNIHICFLLMAQDGCLSSSCHIRIPTNRKDTHSSAENTCWKYQAFFFLFFLYPIGRYLVTWLYLPLRETGTCLHSVRPRISLTTGLLLLRKEERMNIREEFVLSAPYRNRPFTAEIQMANFKSELTRNFWKQIKIFLNWQKWNVRSRPWKYRFSYERCSGTWSNKAS